MATSLCRSTAWFTTVLAVTCAAAASSLAQTSEWRPDLIAKYESEGGQNVPNFLFDGPYGKRSAGGVCQMLTRNWLRVAPMIDIDIGKFPVAGTATEFDQWRACWKLWTLDGYGAWTCCNAKLKRALNQPETAATAARPTSMPAKETEQPKGRVALTMERLAASSDVYNALGNRR